MDVCAKELVRTDKVKRWCEGLRQRVSETSP